MAAWTRFEDDASGYSERPGFGMPVAVTGGPTCLTAAQRAEIRELSGAQPARFFRELVVTWVAIALLIVIGVWADNVPVTIICVALVGTRQMVLALLMHEQVHRLGLRTAYADWLLNLFVVYPLLVTTIEHYAKVHLAHHKYFMTDRDPDFLRKSGRDWTFPASIKTILKIVVKDISGLNTVAVIRGKTAPGELQEFGRPNPTPFILRLFFFVVVATIVAASHQWINFFIYWVLPLLTVTQLLLRWIAVVEHKYNVEHSLVHDVTPLVELTWWQKIVTPDLNFAMHVYHHMHPGVSFSHLPKVHAIYREAGLVDEAAIFKGQGSYIKYLATGAGELQ